MRERGKGNMLMQQCSQLSMRTTDGVLCEQIICTLTQPTLVIPRTSALLIALTHWMVLYHTTWGTAPSCGSFNVYTTESPRLRLVAIMA